MTLKRTLIKEVAHDLYTIKTETWEMEGNPSVEVTSAYALDGSYISEASNDLLDILNKYQIVAQKRLPELTVATIGKDAKDRWWGWSHRAISKFHTEAKASAFAESIASITEQTLWTYDFQIMAPTHVVVEPLLTGSRVPPMQRLASMVARRQAAYLADQYSVVNKLDHNISVFCEAFGLTSPMGETPIKPISFKNSNESFAPEWSKRVTAMWLAQSTAALQEKGYAISRSTDGNITTYIAKASGDEWKFICSADATWCFALERNDQTLPVFIQQQSELGSFMAGVPGSVAESGDFSNGILIEEGRQYVKAWQTTAARIAEIATL